MILIQKNQSCISVHELESGFIVTLLKLIIFNSARLLNWTTNFSAHSLHMMLII